MKRNLKLSAIELRRKGYTYSEILKQIPVAKSTLSLWLRSINLSKKQFQKLTVKKLESAKRGGQARRIQRLFKTEEIRKEALLEICKINHKELLLIGAMLYWAEGSKSKEYSPSTGVIFSNSDPFMVKIFIKWLKICLGISDDRIKFQIYIHENHKNNLIKVKNYWSLVTGFPCAKFDKIYYKKHNPATKRRNKGNTYYGLLRICIKESTSLNRKIAGWIEGICKQCGVV